MQAEHICKRTSANLESRFGILGSFVPSPMGVKLSTSVHNQPPLTHVYLYLLDVARKMCASSGGIHRTLH